MPFVDRSPGNDQTASAITPLTAPHITPETVHKRGRLVGLGHRQGNHSPCKKLFPVPIWPVIVGLQSLGTEWINLADAFQVARLPEYREVIVLDQHSVSIGYEDLIASCDRGDQEALGQSGLAKGLVGDG